MTKKNKNSAIIGAGHNGLICATYLAKKGYAVNVYEARSEIGGMASTREFSKGYKVPGAAHLIHLLDEGVENKLNLKKHGLEYAATNLKTVSLNLDGNPLIFDGDTITGDSITLREQEEYKSFQQEMHRLALFFKKTYQDKPPRLASGDNSDLKGLASLGLNLRRMGGDSMSNMLKFIAINIYDTLNEYFEDPFIKGSIALDAVLGNHMGPRTNNSVITYLHQLTGKVNGSQGSYAIPKGGMESLQLALQNSAEEAGVTIHTDSPVKQIKFSEENKVTGLVLKDGNEIDADIVISGVDPKSTFMCLVGPKKLEYDFVHKIKNIRTRGNASKVHLALSTLPKFNGVNKEDLGQRIIISPSMEYLEQAFDFTKYQTCSNNLPMEIVIPTIYDQSLAPNGHHVLSAIVNYTPRTLDGGWAREKENILENVINTLNQYAPGIKEKILHSELLSPEDIENEYGATGGQWHHGELTFDQFLMLRPASGIAQYHTPIDSLYLCGAGSHPGGGLMGLAGKNAATEIIAREG